MSLLTADILTSLYIHTTTHGLIKSINESLSISLNSSSTNSRPYTYFHLVIIRRQVDLSAHKSKRLSLTSYKLRMFPIRKRKGKNSYSDQSRTEQQYIYIRHNYNYCNAHRCWSRRKKRRKMFLKIWKFLNLCFWPLHS